MEARGEARALHTRVKQDGADPVAQPMGAAAKEGVGTLAALLDLYGEKRGNAQKAWPESRKRINLVCNPLLAKPVAAVSASDFQMVVDTPKDAEGRHTIVIIAAQAGASLPQQGDVIYFEIPEALGQRIQSLRAEVHIYLFSLLPSSPVSALERQPIVAAPPPSEADSGPGANVVQGRFDDIRQYSCAMTLCARVPAQRADLGSTEFDPIVVICEQL